MACIQHNCYDDMSVKLVMICRNMALVYPNRIINIENKNPLTYQFVECIATNDMIPNILAIIMNKCLNKNHTLEQSIAAGGLRKVM